MRQRATCDHTALLSEIERHKQRGKRMESGIEHLMASHQPKFRVDEWGLRPGNSHNNVQFYCERCSVAWPCPTFNDLRWLYGNVNEWSPARHPYLPLTLQRADEERAP